MYVRLSPYTARTKTPQSILLPPLQSTCIPLKENGCANALRLSCSFSFFKSLRAGWGLPSYIVCIAWIHLEPRRHFGGRVRVPTAETTSWKRLASILARWEMRNLYRS
ncbi:hypothetical protein KSP40_PGU015677 [Platanthera guangdongensis]|uniref:Uncharacterized protein n=1 Tax=Platanthera guangdongensis TaxID=2320717 RepID=A0ABR2MI65_9ASPA